MKKRNLFFQETDPESEEGGPAPEVTPEVTPAEWGGPSKEEWQTVVGGLHYLSQQLQEAGQEPEEEPDFENMDAGDIVQHYVDSRIGELEPYVQSAAREAGEKRMNELFDEFEKDPQIGKFDRRVASRLAEAVYGEVGDPVEACRQAATMVSGLSKAERDQAVKEYKDSLKRRTFDDPGVTGGGERTPLPAKSYDEVIARWSGQEDV